MFQARQKRSSRNISHLTRIPATESQADQVFLNRDVYNVSMAYLATIAPFGFEDFHPPSWLATMRRLGCQACQYYRDENHSPDLAEVKKITTDTGLPIDSLHGLFGPTLDPSSPDETQRRHAVSVYQAEAQIAVELEAPCVVVHPAPMAQSPENRSPQAIARRVDPMRRTLCDLAQLGERQEVTFLIENLPGQFMFGQDPTQLASLLRELNSPRLGMCFDTGHAHMTCAAPETLNACADVVRYLHVSDNNAQVDAHLFPGHGTLDWKAMGHSIAKLNPRIPAMLELFFPAGMMQREFDQGLKENLTWMLGLSDAGHEAP